MINPELCQQLVNRVADDLSAFALPRIDALATEYGLTDAQIEAVTVLVWQVSRETAHCMMELCTETTAEVFREIEREFPDEMSET